jgi:hypothetical protein
MATRHHVIGRELNIFGVGYLAVEDQRRDESDAARKLKADSSLKGNTISPHWKGWCDGRRLHTTDGCGAGEDRAWTT